MEFTQLIQLLPKVLGSLPAIVAYCLLVLAILAWRIRAAKSRDWKRLLDAAAKNADAAVALAKATGFEHGFGGQLSEAKKVKLRLAILKFIIILALILAVSLLAAALIQELGKSKTLAEKVAVVQKEVAAMQKKGEELQKLLDLEKQKRGIFLGDLGELEGRLKERTLSTADRSKIQDLIAELKQLRTNFAQSAGEEYISQADRDRLRVIDATIAVSEYRLKEADDQLSDGLLNRLHDVADARTSEEINANMLALAIRIDRGRLKEALSCADRILYWKPEHSFALSQKARAQFLLGQIEEAISTLASIDPKKYTFFPEFHNPQSVIAFKTAGKGGSAIDFQILPLLSRRVPCSELTAAEERKQLIRVWLCETLRSENRDKEADDLARKAVSVCPRDVQAQFEAAAGAFKRHDQKTVEACFSAICEVSPSAENLLMLGISRIQVENFAGAISPLEKSKELDLGNNQTLTSLAIAYFKVGNYEKACPNAEKALSAGWNLGLAKFLNESYRNLHRYDKVIEIMNQFLEHEETTADIYEHRGAAYYNLGRYQDAVNDYEAMLRLEPANAQALYLCSMANGQLGKLNEALQYAQRLCKEHPDYPDAFVIWADFLRANNRLPEALTVLEKGREAGKETDAMRFCFALVYSALNRQSDSKPILDDLIARQESLPDLLRVRLKEFLSSAKDEAKPNPARQTPKRNSDKKPGSTPQRF